MANVVRAQSFFTIASGDTFFLSPPSAENATVGTLSIMLVSNSFSGSITVKSISSAPECYTGGTAGAPETPLAVQYSARYLNGAISSDTLLSTAITGTSLILVPASGQTIVLDTTYTSGKMRVYVVPMAGAAV